MAESDTPKQIDVPDNVDIKARLTRMTMGELRKQIEGIPDDAKIMTALIVENKD